jgi:hypothetical protein
MKQTIVRCEDEHGAVKQTLPLNFFVDLSDDLSTSDIKR